MTNFLTDQILAIGVAPPWEESPSAPSWDGSPAACGPRSPIPPKLRSTHQITAIRILREATGLGLKESKDLVEAMDVSKL